MKKLFYKITTILCITLMCVGIYPATTTFAAASDTVMVTGTYNYGQAFEVLDIVNQEREAAGLSDLSMDQGLLDAAMQRAAEVSIYFSHTRPSGEQCFTVSSQANAENIAAGESSASAVMSDWMNSDGHRNNIMSEGAQSIGVGCFVQGGTTYWVQLFGTGGASGAGNAGSWEDTVSIAIDPGLFNGCLSLQLSEYELETGQSASSSVSLANPEFSGAYAALDPSQFVWSSSSSDVTVDAYGTVTAVNAGSADITVSTASGGLYATTSIQVNGTEAQTEVIPEDDPYPQGEQTPEDIQEPTDEQTPGEVQEPTDEQNPDDEQIPDENNVEEYGDAPKEDEGLTDEEIDEDDSGVARIEMDPEEAVIKEGEVYTLQPTMSWYSSEYPNGVEMDFSFLEEEFNYIEGSLVTADGETTAIGTDEMEDLLSCEFLSDKEFAMTAGTLNEEYEGAVITLNLVTEGDTSWLDENGTWTWTTQFQVTLIREDAEEGAEEGIVPGNGDGTTGDAGTTDITNVTNNTTNNINNNINNTANVTANNINNSRITVFKNAPWHRGGPEKMFTSTKPVRKGDGKTNSGIRATTRPKTGDNTLMVRYLLIAAAACGGIAGVVVYRRRKA
ncbi:MAG: CAP domain-containing protein [Lachnospiraceae bacterium]|nr:CAP domain-containing protein [Lachnospiraceae bacterium]